MKFQATQISLLVSGLFMAASVSAQSTTDVGTINVEGQPGGTATGLIQQEETPKARSSVGRKSIENQSPTNNPYQVINLLPGVSTFSHDGTGLFGGSLRIRGFNSDQLGFTIDGVPVNDSGSFTVFPQEYTDTDNLCEVFVTQGSTDTEAPHVGATGGNVGLVTCGPTDTRRVRVSQTIGNNALSKTFLRYDTGKFLDDRAKMFFSVSHAEAEKFKGKGDAYREHIDYKGEFQLGGGSFLGAGFLYNRAVNNNYRTVSKVQIEQQGKYYDFGERAPIHQPAVAGTAQDDSAYGPNANIYAGQQNRYYGFNLNPFRNYIATLKGHFQLAPNASVDVEPYMWYGYGTGGNQLQTQREANSPATAAALRGGGQVHGGAADLNGDGDTLDTVGAYEGSITKTYRPGVTTKVNWDIAGNRILAGYWIEHARHQQTAPYVAIDDNGNAADIWLRNQDQYLRNTDGSRLQFRDWYTVTSARSAFLQDTVSFLQDKLTVVGGGRYTTVGRKFQNSANQGTSITGLGQTGVSGVDYAIQKDYSAFLPNLGIKYQLTTEQSVFVNGTKNFKAPPNFAYSNLAVSNNSQFITYVNGVATNFHVLEPQVGPEKSNNYDVGYRYAGERVTFSGSVFYINYKDRIAALLDPNSNQPGQAINLGDSTTKGFELEAGYKIAANLSAYGSLSYTKSRIKSDIQYGNSTRFEATSGKEFPDTPKWLAGFAIQYQDATWLAGVDAKYTGKRYSTLVNDDSINGYTLVGLTAGYKIPSNAFFKNPMVRLNVYNLFSRDYLSLNGPSGSNFGVRSNPVAGLPTYSAQTFYVGAPRTIAVTLASDF